MWVLWSKLAEEQRATGEGWGVQSLLVMGHAICEHREENGFALRGWGIAQEEAVASEDVAH